LNTFHAEILLESLPHLDDSLCFQAFVERKSDVFSMPFAVFPKILHSANQFSAFSEGRNRRKLCHSADIILRTPGNLRNFFENLETEKPSGETAVTVITKKFCWLRNVKEVTSVTEKLKANGAVTASFLHPETKQRILFQ
jgi:hypothetical protein